MKQPWMKFYPSDWRSDPRLRMCSLAARGLWMEMLTLMHEATPYGHLLISGIAPTDAQLAVLAGAPSEQIPGLLGELESAGVFSRTQKGTIYSRRMTRDDKKAAQARKNGKTGGNPSLRKDGGNSPSDNPPDKGRDKTQIPDTRYQIPERINNPPLEQASARQSAEAKPPEQPFQAPIQPEADIVAEFAEFRRVYPRREALEAAQRALVVARFTTSFEVIMAGVRAYAAFKANDPPKYILYPARWLDERRWTDQLPEPEAAKPSANVRRLRALTARFSDPAA